jgi:hypothetical protein
LQSARAQLRFAQNDKQSRSRRQQSEYIPEIDQGLGEIAAIRRGMKNTDARIRRLEASTRRKLDHIRAHLPVENAA